MNLLSFPILLCSVKTSGFVNTAYFLQLNQYDANIVHSLDIYQRNVLYTKK